MKKITLFLFFSLSLFFSSAAKACDICAIYSPLEEKEQQADLSIGLAEQFVSYSKIQTEDKHVDNEIKQHLNSSTTQIYLSYSLLEDLSIRANIPYISRRFARAEAASRQTGSEVGLGDVSLSLNYKALKYECNGITLSINTYAGVKLPTGDSDRLAEEHHHQDVQTAMHRALKHEEHQVSEAAHNESAADMETASESDEMHPQQEADQHNLASAIHGHDLALGSGSYDFPVGANFKLQYKEIFAKLEGQYLIRQRGDYDYKYADHLILSSSLGFMPVMKHDLNIALSAHLIAEHKSKDSSAEGMLEDDTAFDSLFAGPELSVVLASGLSFDLAADWPLDINNSGTQAVVGNRVRSALKYRF